MRRIRFLFAFDREHGMVFGIRLLPWEYGVRNLGRRPVRTGLTLIGLATVVLMVLTVVAFIRGLESTLDVSGDPDVALIFALGMGENLEYSSIPTRTSDLVASSVPGIRQRYGQRYASPELYLGTRVATPDLTTPAMGLVRGVTPAALLVHRRVELIEGDWPGPGEVLVGRLADVKLSASQGELSPGNTIEFEGKTWRISGRFAARGSVFESELWCRLDDLQQAMKRQDLSLVAVTLEPGASYAEVDLFCKQRLDLELQAVRQRGYYATLRKDYGPVRSLAWVVMGIVTAAGSFAGLNTMYGAVVGRTREMATLQTIGFRRRAIVLSLIQEGTVLAMGASLLAAIAAAVFIHELPVRFTMGAFEMRVDSVTMLVGCATGLFLGVVGSLPPAIRIITVPVVDGLKSV